MFNPGPHFRRLDEITSASSLLPDSNSCSKASLIRKAADENLIRNLIGSLAFECGDLRKLCLLFGGEVDLHKAKGRIGGTRVNPFHSL